MNRRSAIPPQPLLIPLSNDQPRALSERLACLHRQIVTLVPEVDQIACVLYEPETDLLKTFIDSSAAGRPLRGYEFPLAGSESLSELVQTRSARILDDLPATAAVPAHHAVHMRAAGFRSSYTVPLFDDNAFQGFLFMDSLTPAAFTPEIVARLEVHVELVRMLLCRELTAARTLVGSVQVARDFAQVHDAQVSRHLDRMARFARLIARRLATERQLSDEFVEHVFLFAPLHDIGKVGVPDTIIRKPDSLTADERTVMSTHVELGVRLVETLIESFRLTSLSGVSVLRNIVASHHELLDGSGYPRGLAGDAIPLEARIATVADIFDALASRRDYKHALDVDASFGELDRMAAAGKLDPACVAALIAQRQDVEDIIRRFGTA
jgi:HD-GYP domain-containing protein (c-di-GMP phosphodiesterase class II)